MKKAKKVKMGCCKAILAAIVLIVAASVFFLSRRTFEVPQEFYQDHYWGRQAWKVGDPVPKDDTTIRPRKIVYDEEVIKDLHARLDKTRFVEPIQNDFEYGFNGEYLKKLVQHWRHKFDWKKQVDFLNSYPQYVTQIEGIDVHFLRIKPEGSAKVVKPILLVNGWPSSFSHYYKLADLLRKPVNGVAFEVVIPSRPGFGYSEQPHRPGFSLADSVRVYVKLMKRLGHNKFFYAGEDWGSMEAHAIAVLYPENLEGVHSSMVPGAQHSIKTLLKVAVGVVAPSLVYSSPIEAKKWVSPIAVLQTTLKEAGYFAIQATKPDTIGASLIDSPAGLAAYYLEKMAAGVNYEFIDLPDGGLTKVVTMDELLTNVMISWCTGNGANALRYYKEFVRGDAKDLTKAKASDKVPFGFSVGEHEISISMLKPCCGRYNLVKFDYVEGVGHFASLEAPKKVEKHLREFVEIVIEKNQNTPKSEL